MSITRRVVVPLRGEVADALWEMSQRELRHPRDQVQKLVIDGLMRAGVLADQGKKPASRWWWWGRLREVLPMP